MTISAYSSRFKPILYRILSPLFIFLSVGEVHKGLQYFLIALPVIPDVCRHAETYFFKEIIYAFVRIEFLVLVPVVLCYLHCFT
jgi:hypothetical protein